MATVDLETVLLSPASDLSDVIELDVSALSEGGGKEGGTRRYAGGTTRAVSRAGKAVAIGLEFDIVSDRDLVETIRSWEGELLLFRDPRGRKVWCQFWQPDIEENIVVDVATVSLTLQQVTYPESAST